MNPATHPGTLSEFARALGRSFTYNPFKNLYLVFGLIWGCPVPAVALGTLMLIHEGSWSQEACNRLLEHHPTLWFFTLYPLLFGVILGAIGTIRHEKDLRIDQLINRLNRESRTDPLTGLPNRRAFLEQFRFAYERAVSDTTPLSVAMFDLDHFKDVNDRHGHDFGDAVLKAFARLLESGSRGGDLPARWGGEEFILVLPGATDDQATIIAERIRHHLEIQPITEGPLSVAVTVSGGVTQFRPGEPAETLFNRADQMLYSAKAGGRNCIHTG